MRRTTVRPFAVALLLFLSACALFTDDATPALEASQAREGIFRRQSAAFETVVTKATGINEGQRAAMLAGITKDREDYGELADATHKWLEELGSVKWIDIAKRAYKQWKDRE